ncbi:MAG: hypothetical protein Marn2KO_34020 [Marinobacter nauticus]
MKVALAMIISAIALVAFLSYLTDRVTDDERFAHFEEACRTAQEQVFSNVLSNSIALEYYPVSGVIEQDYYPTKLASELLSEPERFQTVQLLFNSDDLSSSRPRTNLLCEGSFIISATNKDQLKLGLCGMVGGKKHYRQRQSKTNVSDVVIRYRYGPRNKYDVRKFIFLIEDYKNGELLALQSSYQLLLGQMAEKENRVWLGWGAAEGTRNCQLSPPKDFVLSVVEPNG